MKTLSILVSFLLCLGSHLSAQQKVRHWTEAMEGRYEQTQPVLHYTLVVDTSDLHVVHVELSIRNIPDSFELAMMTHPEYDDRYFRYVEDLTIETEKGKGQVRRIDSCLWKVFKSGNDVRIRYKIRYPQVSGARSAWKAFMHPKGGLTGGPHTFMYLPGATLASAHIRIIKPAHWRVATGLVPTADPNVFYAASARNLLDAPIFTGEFKTWSFLVENIPHHVSYWSLPGSPEFDSERLVRSLKKLVEEGMRLFGRLPYREYHFMMQDGAWGALEHNNSVTVGASATNLANNPDDILPEIAHEYIHTWNLVRIRPEEYGDVPYKKQVLSKGLWFSEGLTIFYSDLLMRRAGLTVFDSTRLLHLQNLVRRYLGTPVYLQFSAEKISEAAYGPIGMLGEFSANPHLLGELLGALLDLIIRDATGGKRSMDDLMRLMMQRFSGEKGFSSRDIEKAVTEVCDCDVSDFFRDYVYGHKAIDFKRYLALMGMDYEITWKDVTSNQGQLVPDFRVYSYQAEGENQTRIGLGHPNSSWARSGLHTGDILLAVNDSTVTNRNFRALIRNAKIGDTLRLRIERKTGVELVNVLITSYQQPFARIFPVNPGVKQKELFRQWSELR
jgi:predicted metalloprotease with PDZ domain